MMSEYYENRLRHRTQEVAAIRARETMSESYENRLRCIPPRLRSGSFRLHMKK